MKTTALAALTAAVCLSAACEFSKSRPVPTAPDAIDAAAPSAPPTPAAHPGYPRTGQQVVSYVVKKHPERLVATRNYKKRSDNMIFLRDRMIVAGMCGGMDLARNLKRGRGPLSMDAIAYRPGNGRTEVVDIAQDWSNYRRPLRLHWLIVGGQPGWSPMGAPNCPPSP